MLHTLWGIEFAVLLRLNGFIQSMRFQYFNSVEFFSKNIKPEVYANSLFTSLFWQNLPVHYAAMIQYIVIVNFIFSNYEIQSLPFELIILGPHSPTSFA